MKPGSAVDNNSFWKLQVKYKVFMAVLSRFMFMVAVLNLLAGLILKLAESKIIERSQWQILLYHNPSIAQPTECSPGTNHFPG